MKKSSLLSRSKNRASKPINSKQGSKHYDGNVININASNKDWDEDIDDDIAFNSDDEEMYGHFFAGSETQKKDKKKKKDADKKVKNASGMKSNGARSDDVDIVFERLNAINSVNNNERNTEDDNDLDGINIGEVETKKKKKKKSSLGDGISTKTSPGLIGGRLSSLGGRLSSLGGRLSSLGGRSGATHADDVLMQHGENLLIAIDDIAKISTSNKRAAKQKKQMKEVDELAELANAHASSRVKIKSIDGVADLDTLVAGTEAADEGKTAKRLKAATTNTRTLLTEEVDDYTKSKLDRALTREMVAKELKRYNQVLKEHKEAKHVRFPLNQPDSSPIPVSLGGVAASVGNLNEKRFTTDVNSPASVTVPSGAAGLGAKMQELLQRSGLASKPGEKVGRPLGAFGEDGQGYVGLIDREDNDGGDVNEFAMGADGVPSKNYMAKLKSLVSYEVQRKIRMKKIKSKTYRRILRKEKERDEQRKLQALELLNPEAARRRRQHAMEKDRALERVTQKHKNTSKWVRHAKKYSKFDEDTKEAIEAQHLEHQRLMSKMDEDAGEEWAEYEDAEKASIQNSLDEDREVDALLADVDENGEKAKESSIFWTGNNGTDNDNQHGDDYTTDSPFSKARQELQQMGFMKRKRERDNAQFEAEMNDLREDIARYKEGLDPIHYTEDDEGTRRKGKRKAVAVTTGNIQHSIGHGRKVFDVTDGLNTKTSVSSVIQKKSKSKENNEVWNELGLDYLTEEICDEPTETTTITTNKKSKGRRNAVVAPLKATGITVVEESNSYPLDDVEMSNTHNVHIDSVPEQEYSQESDDGSFAGHRNIKKDKHFLVDNKSTVTNIPQLVTKKNHTTPATTITIKVDVDTDKNKEESTTVRQPHLLTSKSHPVPHQSDAAQEYLVTRAFSRDDVDEDFLKLKEQQVEDVMKPIDKNISLPGWGEWGGESERLNKRHQEKVAKADLKRRIEKSSLMKSRADANLDHLVINHDVDIIPDKYQLHMVPRPFSNVKEFDKFNRHPTGPEWNTPMTFKERTQPQITTKQGTIIDPLDITNRKVKAKTERKKIQNKHVI